MPNLGWEKIESDSVFNLHYKYNNQEKAEVEEMQVGVITGQHLCTEISSKACCKCLELLELPCMQYLPAHNVLNMFV